jgi:hypothetical protein
MERVKKLLMLFSFFPFPLYLPSTDTGQMKTGKEKAESRG